MKGTSYIGDIKVRDYNGNLLTTGVFKNPIKRDLRELHQYSYNAPMEKFEADPCPLLARGIINPDNGELIVWSRDVLHNSMAKTDLFKGKNPYFHFEEAFPIEIDKQYNIQCAYLRQVIDDIRSSRYDEIGRMLVYYRKSVKLAKKKYPWIKSSDTYKV